MTIRDFLRAIVVTLSMYIVTHLYVMVFLPYAILISYVDANRIPALKEHFVRSLFAIAGEKLAISGRENVLPDHDYVIIANYPSFYAGFALIGAFPQACVVAHAFLRRIPLLGHALHRVGVIFVQPGRQGLGRSAIDLGLSRGSNRSIIILPEGARTPDGRIRRFRRGFLRILRQTSLDLLPVTLNGMYQLKPVRRLYADPRAEIEMIIHPPLSHATISGRADGELLAIVSATIGAVYRP